MTVEEGVQVQNLSTLRVSKILKWDPLQQFTDLLIYKYRIKLPRTPIKYY